MTAGRREEESTAIGDAVRRLAFAPDEAFVGRAIAYLDLLERWSAVYNLTAIRDRAAMRVQHVNDSLAIAAALARGWDRSTTPRLLDVGSGAGLPGLIVAACWPEVSVTCIDPVGKKVAFIAQAAGTLGLANVHALQGRVEDHRPAASYDLVTARAFATLADTVQATRHAIAPGGSWALAKGRPPTDEIAELPPDVEVFHVERLRVSDMPADRHLVWIRPGAPNPVRTP